MTSHDNPGRGTAASTASAGCAAHLAVAALGAAALIVLASPVDVDGLSVDFFPVVVVGVGVLVLAPAAEVLEGLAARRSSQAAPLVVLLAFACLAIVPPAVVASPWLADEDPGQPLSLLVQALAGWALANLLQWLTARGVSRPPRRPDKD